MDVEKARSMEQRQRKGKDMDGEEDEGDKKMTKTGKKKRGRVEMRRIEDRVSRQVRFSKRRKGLFKKAFELSKLCDAQIALVVFSPAGRLYEFASSRSSIESVFDRYWDLGNTINDLNIEARDSWIDCNTQIARSTGKSLFDQLNNIAQRTLESDGKDLSMAELRGIEETVTDALTIIKNKLTLKSTGLPPTQGAINLRTAENLDTNP